MYKASVSPETWTAAPIGFYNGGGIRTTIEPTSTGEITRGELLAAIPFGSTLLTLTLNGSDLIKTLEIGARTNGETSAGEFLQVSGLKVVYDMSQPSMSRVVSVQARCGICDIPRYETVDPSANYTIITTSFLAVDAGDGHTVLTENSFNRINEDLNDIDTVAWYIAQYSPIYPEVQGRISFVEDDDDTGDNTDADGDDGTPGFAPTIRPNRYIVCTLVVLGLYSYLL